MARLTYPVQVPPTSRHEASAAVYLAAYEVYCAIHGSQPAMVEGECRGGFGAGELLAFLYAKGFPRSEWRERVDEALTGMRGL